MVEDLKVKLEAIRDLARSRVRMLNEGASFYDADKKAFYLQEYESKISELERLLHDLPSKPLRTNQEEKSGSLKKYWHRMFGDRTRQD